MRIRGTIAVMTSWVLGATGVLAKEDVANKTLETRSIMNTLFEPMAYLLPLSLDTEAFSAKANRPEIAKRLKQLRDNVGVLEKHAGAHGRGFEYVAKSLERDTKNLYRWYTKGHFEEARFTLHNMTENCIACHSSLPETQKFPRSEAFFGKVDISKLPALERAHLQVMTRQFDEALKTYETVFLSKEIHPLNLVMLGSFTDYLKICIHVKNDLARPEAMLEKIAARTDTPLHVKEQLAKWIVVLKEFDASGVMKSKDLASARKVLEGGRAMMEFPRDRDGLIHHVVSSALLSRYVESHPDRGPDVAEAYYLLGVADSLLEHSLWIQRVDFYLESAIRLAPDADFAPKAYALLEEDLITGYSGSAGTNLPDEAKQLLTELRRLIEQARAAKKT